MDDLFLFHGQYSLSKNKRYILKWNDAFYKIDDTTGKEELIDGEYYLLENHKLILEGKIKRPNTGKVADNGTFIFCDWVGFSGGDNGKGFEGNFIAFTKTGEELINHHYTANLLNNYLSDDGRYALCQTYGSNSPDSLTVSFFDLMKGELLWQKKPETNVNITADDFELRLQENVIYLIYDNLGKFKFSLNGEFLDENEWIQARIKHGSIFDLVEMADIKMLEMGNSINIDLANEALNLYLLALERKGSDYLHAQTHKKIGKLYELIDKNMEAINHYEKAIKLHNTIGVKKSLRFLSPKNVLCKPGKKVPPISEKTFMPGSLIFSGNEKSGPAGHPPRGIYHTIVHTDEVCIYIKNHYTDFESFLGSASVTFTSISGDFLEKKEFNHLIYKFACSSFKGFLAYITYDLKLHLYFPYERKHIMRDISCGVQDRYQIKFLALSENGESIYYSVGSTLFTLDIKLKTINKWKSEIENINQVNSGELPIEALSILGLSGNPNNEEIKSAYRKRLLEVHPDLNRDNSNANDNTREVIHAYETLSKNEFRSENSKYHIEVCKGLDVYLPIFEDEISSILLSKMNNDVFVGFYSGNIIRLSRYGSNAELNLLSCNSSDPELIRADNIAKSKSLIEELYYCSDKPIWTIKEIGDYIYFVSDKIEIIMNHKLIKSVMNITSFTRIFWGKDAFVVLNGHTLNLYTLDGIMFSKIITKENIADIYILRNKLKIVTAKMVFYYSINLERKDISLPINKSTLIN